MGKQTIRSAHFFDSDLDFYEQFDRPNNEREHDDYADFAPDFPDSDCDYWVSNGYGKY